jgi:predicted small lipoprotein YifL
VLSGRSVVGAVAVMLMLTACGQRGPLVLPKPAQQAASSTPAASAPAR